MLINAKFERKIPAAKHCNLNVPGRKEKKAEKKKTKKNLSVRSQELKKEEKKKKKYKKRGPRLYCR